MSDFKSNEYANLLGGRDFEPHEENPMIGWRGASRYYDPNYRSPSLLSHYIGRFSLIGLATVSRWNARAFERFATRWALIM